MRYKKSRLYFLDLGAWFHEPLFECGLLSSFAQVAQFNGNQLGEIHHWILWLKSGEYVSQHAESLARTQYRP